MDKKKSDMYLQAGKDADSGWSVKTSPTPVHQPKMPTPTPMPVPMPTPTPAPAPQEPQYIHMVMGMSYVPMQEFRDLYEAEEGFPRGTIFAELDYPFMGKGDCHYD